MKKLISIFIIISLTAAIFSGCGKKTSDMNTLKSNIASVYTPDGRVGTAVVLEDGTLMVPSHLVDSFDGNQDNKGMSYRVVYSDGSEGQAELIGNDPYSNVAILSAGSNDSSERTGVSTNDFKAPKEDTELFVAAVNEDGKLETQPVSLIKNVEKDEATALILEGGSIENDRFSGAPIIDADGNVYGVYMTGTDEGTGVGISGDSVHAIVDDLIEIKSPVLNSSDDPRSNIITEVFEEEYSISKEEANKLLNGRKWLDASADAGSVHFSIAQMAGSLIRLKYICNDPNPEFEYVLGINGSSPAICTAGGAEYYYNIPRTFIRNGEGEILMYFKELDGMTGTDSISSIVIGQTGYGDEEIVLDFNVQSVENSADAGFPSNDPTTAEAASALKDFLIGSDSNIMEVLIDDLNNDDLPDMIYSERIEWSNGDYIMYKILAHILIYDGGQLIEPEGISYDLGREKDFSTLDGAMILDANARATEGGENTLCMYDGKLSVYGTQAFAYRKIFDIYEYNGGDFVKVESILGDQRVEFENGNPRKFEAGPNDDLIAEKYNSCEWVWSDVAKLTVDEAIAYLDQLIGESIIYG